MSYLAQHCCTNSKKESCYSYNARKATTDWVCGLGSQLDGWENNKAITEPITEECAKLICKRWHFDRVKFVSSGSDACNAAIRIARTHTGKLGVYQVGYHGCSDFAVSTKEPSKQFIPNQYVVEFSSIGELNSLLEKMTENSDIAAAIVEPLQLKDTKENLEDNRTLLAHCKRLGIVSIFDEIITGLRYPKGLYAARHKLKPDMICMGKAPANGYPVAWCMGPKVMMDNPNYFISNTHNGSRLCVKVYNSINLITDQKLMDFHNDCLEFQEKIQYLLDGHGIKLVGYGTRGEWQGDLNILTAFWELMASRGHFLGRAFFMNMQHTMFMKNKFLKDLTWAMLQLDSGYKRQGRCVQFSFRRN